ncbi:type II toxin-antitoxin system RelE/ParE family toxin [Paraeggerthella sp.]|jgi:toxin ParE1/3/4|uniref:type II toxin-antitoxin system RelE/ParE family toxin n=1 Tax=Paraeggerthella TaxID=651554 RepID=UPI003AB71742
MLDLAWRPRAHLDRESIAIYLGLECKNPQAAFATTRRIDAAIKYARSFPDAGGRFAIERLDHGEYRAVLANPYIVYYRFDNATLTVYRILHQRQSIDTYSLVDLPE